MTNDDLLTPEGDLIRRARERAIPKLSIRAAAARIGISPEHWGNIERGYKSVSSAEPPRRLAPASAALIAKMAQVTGVRPADLTAAGREDAARELEEAQRRPAPPVLAAVPTVGPDVPAAPPGFLTREMEEAALPFVIPIWRRLYALALRGVTDPSGAQVFGDSSPDAGVWDRAASGGWEPWHRAWLVGALRADVPGRARESGTGLLAAPRRHRVTIRART